MLLHSFELDCFLQMFCLPWLLSADKTFWYHCPFTTLWNPTMWGLLDFIIIIVRASVFIAVPIGQIHPHFLSGQEVIGNLSKDDIDKNTFLVEWGRNITSNNVFIDLCTFFFCDICSFHYFFFSSFFIRIKRKKHFYTTFSFNPPPQHLTSTHLFI